jgi:hypothetical protein
MLEAGKRPWVPGDRVWVSGQDIKNNLSLYNQTLAVKKFDRPTPNDIAVPELIRPLHVLKHTLHYLCKHVISRFDKLYEEDLANGWGRCDPWYFFVHDRLRAIMKEANQQGYIANRPCKTIIRIYERIARFFLLCNHHMAGR